MKSFMSCLLGWRKTADFKRFLVKSLPSSLLTFLQRKLINFIPEDFYRTGMIFVHVPKAAGTSISRAIFGQSTGHMPAWYICKVDPEFWARAHVFTVVRDPVERLVSAYNFLLTGGTRDVGVESPGIYTGKEFESFESFVMSWLAPRFSSIEHYDYVLWPQFLFLCDKNKKRLIVDNIYHLSDLGLLERDLFSEGKIDSKFDHVNKSVVGSEVQKVLSEEVVGTIRRLYQKDYMLLDFK